MSVQAELEDGDQIDCMQNQLGGSRVRQQVFAVCVPSCRQASGMTEAAAK